MKSSPEKKHKKMEKKVFKILFYFSKMDKNKCPKIVLKKKFQKTRIFCFFVERYYIKNTILSPKIAILVLKTKKSFFGDKLFFFQWFNFLLTFYIKNYHFIPQKCDSYFSTSQIIIFGWCFYTFFYTIILKNNFIRPYMLW